MPILRWSPASPYVRKVTVAALELGLFDSLTLQKTDAHTDESLRAQNPLCKVPTLVLDDGTAIIDSPVICDWLNEQGGGKLIPAAGPARLATLSLQALGDGVLDAAVGRRMEQLRDPHLQSEKFHLRQQAAINAALDRLESLASGFADPPLLGEIAVAAALGYLDFRFGDEDWRAGRPTLTAWWARVGQRPSLQRTVPANP